jgi:hypothetical protein
LCRLGWPTQNGITPATREVLGETGSPFTAQHYCAEPLFVSDDPHTQGPTDDDGRMELSSPTAQRAMPGEQRLLMALEMSLLHAD